MSTLFSTGWRFSAVTDLGGRRLLGLFAHPDDEAYAAGGTLALTAAMGATVTVVSATRGEAGQDLCSDGVEDLATRRSRELANSCAVLGVGRPVFLEMPDGGLADLSGVEAANSLLRVLERLEPEVVVTLGSDGAYGHNDHLATTRFLDLAVRRLDGPKRPRVLHAAFPRGLFRPVWRALRRCPGVIDPQLAGDAIGTSRDTTDLRVDISAVADTKREAVACHESQLAGGDPDGFLIPGLIDDLLTEEWFTVACGPPVPRDAAHPFAGL